MKRASYKGPVCYVGHDHEAADGRPLQGGWHYTVVEGPGGVDMPGEPLFLDHEIGRYRYATDSDASWHERHHQELTTIAVYGNMGEPRTAEEIEAAHRHLDQLEQRLTGEGLHEQESDHALTTPEDVQFMRRQLEKAQKP